MPEYIVEYPDDLVAEGFIEECINVHERIVRCKDCENLIKFSETSPQAGFGMCRILKDAIYDTSFTKYDNFCALGKERKK